jgi:hypothetical protein
MPLFFKESWGQVKPKERPESFVSPFCMQAGVGFDAACPSEEKPATPGPQVFRQGSHQQTNQRAQLQPSLDIPGLLKDWDASGSGMLKMDSWRLPSMDLGFATRSSCVLPT